MLVLIGILLAIFVIPWPWGILAVIIGGLLDIVESYFFMRWSRRRKATTGAETLVGQTAVASSALRPEGQVRIVGELWTARSSAGADAGDEVVVRGVEGLTLLVD